ncbi:MAG: non-homologous end-joining DNA ligase [Candidatus Woesearchaeota archaeon]|jgi:bifunctional non-homologous end joining protein LigD
MKPMLAKLVNDKSHIDVLNTKGHIYEPKLDGIRAILYFNKNKRNIFKSRNNIDITKRFENIDLSKIKAKSCILDGEIVSYNKEGNPDFHILQTQEGEKEAVFVVFDILNKNGKNLKNIPLLQRKKILNKTIIENKSLQTIFYTTKGKKLFLSMKKRKMEGIIAKKSNSFYLEGIRSDNWLKIKNLNTIDCIIIGFTKGKRKISSLALGLYKNKKIIYVGKVGTGFSEKFIDTFEVSMSKIKEDIKNKLSDESKNLPKEIIFVRPKHVAEIEYLEFTKDEKLRAPVFKRLRDDKSIKECIFP